MSAPAELAGGRLRLDFPAAHVARLTIDNPAKRNALDRELLDALAATVAGLDARCLLLTGAGPMFSAGYDIGDLPTGEAAAGRPGADRHASAGEPGADAAPQGHPPAGKPGADAAPQGRPPAGKPGADAAPQGHPPAGKPGADRPRGEVVGQPFEAALAALDAFPLPSLAALNGHAIGGGLELALACDLRIAAASAKLGMPPARLGVVYSHTGLRRFLDAIGAPRTRELFFVARNITAATALEWGLVNEVTEDADLADAAVALAATIAANAPLSLRGNKRALGALLAAEGALDPAVERELIAQRAAAFDSADLREGVRAFAEKRPPRWEGR